MKKTVLMDVDGVILRYAEGFTDWVESKKKLVRTPQWGLTYSFTPWYDTDLYMGELVEEFNHTVHAGRLLPYHAMVGAMEDAATDFGVDFCLITKFGTDANLKRSRRDNLFRHIDKDIISDIIFVPLTGSKEPYLEPWRDSGSLYVEDCPINAEIGKRMGLEVVLHHTSYTKMLSDEIGVRTITGNQLYDEIGLLYS